MEIDGGVVAGFFAVGALGLDGCRDFGYGCDAAKNGVGEGDRDEFGIGLDSFCDIAATDDARIGSSCGCGANSRVLHVGDNDVLERLEGEMDGLGGASGEGDFGRLGAEGHGEFLAGVFVGFADADGREVESRRVEELIR